MYVRAHGRGIWGFSGLRGLGHGGLGLKLRVLRVGSRKEIKSSKLIGHFVLCMALRLSSSALEQQLQHLVLFHRSMVKARCR